MKSKKATKRALLSSALSLVLCFSMLLGTTFAWFTDEASTGVNIIKTGTLDVEMYWTDGKNDPDAEATVWDDASNDVIFNNVLWEPGYTEVRHIKICNEGTLALKYQLNVAANGDVSDLADAIDVYFADPAVQVDERVDLSTVVTRVGTLSQILAGMPDNASGELEAGKSVMVTLALKMPENAGNEYQGLEIGSGFIVQLLATQLAYESDSFDNQYDADAEYLVVNESAAIVNNNGTLGEEVVITGDMPFGTIKVTVPAGAQLSSADVADLKLTVKYADVNENVAGRLTENQVANGYEIYVDGIADYINPYVFANGNKGYNYSDITVELPIGIGRKDVKVYKDGMMPSTTWASYDSASGLVTFSADYLTPFSQAKKSNITVVYTKLTEAEKQLNEVLENIVAGAAGGVVTINSTADNMVTVNNIADALNGSSGITLTGVSKDDTVLMANDATITADDLTMKNMTIQSVQDLVIKGNDTTIENVDYQHGIGSYGLTLAGSDTTIKDTTVSGSASQGLVWYSSASDTASSVTTVEGTTIKDTSTWGASNGITFQNIAGTFAVKDCDISVRGAALQLGPNRGITQGIVNVVETDIDATGVSISTVKTSTFDNVSFANTWSDSGIRFTLGGQTNTFTSCDFKDDVNFISGNYGGKSVTLILNNCTYNGAAITAENVLDHFAFNEATWGLNVRDNLTLIVNGTTVTVPNA